jgi:hypothetical protein
VKVEYTVVGRPGTQWLAGLVICVTSLLNEAMGVQLTFKSTRRDKMRKKGKMEHETGGQK